MKTLLSLALLQTAIASKKPIGINEKMMESAILSSSGGQESKPEKEEEVNSVTFSDLDGIYDETITKIKETIIYPTSFKKDLEK
jgi:hypothetical protein